MLQLHDVLSTEYQLVWIEGRRAEEVMGIDCTKARLVYIGVGGANIGGISVIITMNSIGRWHEEVYMLIAISHCGIQVHWLQQSGLSSLLTIKSVLLVPPFSQLQSESTGWVGSCRRWTRVVFFTPLVLFTSSRISKSNSSSLSFRTSMKMRH